MSDDRFLRCWLLLRSQVQGNHSLSRDEMKMKTNIQKYVHTALLANLATTATSDDGEVRQAGMKVNIHKDQGSANLADGWWFSPCGLDFGIPFFSLSPGWTSRAIIFQRSAQSKNASGRMNEMHKLYMMNIAYEEQIYHPPLSNRDGLGGNMDFFSFILCF